MMRLFDRKGQSTLEYAILIAVVVGALIGMQTYVRRGLQGRLRDAALEMSGGTANDPNLFEPGESSSAQTVTSTGTDTVTTAARGQVSTTSNVTETTTGSSNINAWTE